MEGQKKQRKETQKGFGELKTKSWFYHRRWSWSCYWRWIFSLPNDSLHDDIGSHGLDGNIYYLEFRVVIGSSSCLSVRGTPIMLNSEHLSLRGLNFTTIL